MVKQYVLNILISLDQLVNAFFAGDPDETISSRAAKSKLRGHRFGCVLCKFLDYLDPDHCNKSLEWDRGEKV